MPRSRFAEGIASIAFASTLFLSIGCPKQEVVREDDSPVLRQERTTPQERAGQDAVRQARLERTDHAPPNWVPAATDGARGEDPEKEEAKRQLAAMLAGCRQGIGAACQKLGELGNALARQGQTELAAKIYEYLCQLDNAAGCHNLGILLKRQDVPAAMAAFLKACEHGDSDGCVEVAGNLLDQGDLMKSMELFMKACGDGNQKACTAMRLFHEQFARMCDQEHVAGACAVTAMLYFSNLADRQDFRRAARYAREGCRLGDHDACELLPQIPVS